MLVPLSLVLVVTLWGLAAAAHAATRRTRGVRKDRVAASIPNVTRQWADDVCRRISETQRSAYSTIWLRDEERARDASSLN